MPGPAKPLHADPATGLPLPEPFPDYARCPYCGEPEVEVYCYEPVAHCFKCGRDFEHQPPPGCGDQPACRRNLAATAGRNRSAPGNTALPSMSISPPVRRTWLVPGVVLALTSLTVGVWAGLVRIGWQWAGPAPATHGPLMLCGFLGVVIGLERAAAFRRRWVVLSPVWTGIGAAALLLGTPLVLSQTFVVLGSLILFIAYLVAYWQHYGFRAEASALTMLAGAATWLAGNILWLNGRTVPEVVPWWICFVLLTIAGERLELARVLLRRPGAAALFSVCILAMLTSLLVLLLDFKTGLRLMAIALAGLGGWLLAFDIARRTLFATGLTRFIAACLIPGYIWLIMGGLLWWLWPDFFVTGRFYDAMLHTILVGFVLSMILGHAPLVIPSLSGVPLSYHRVFYVPLGLIHFSLLLRLAGDFMARPELRAWGGLLTAAALILFVAGAILRVRAALAGLTRASFE